jgi:hypothetical protein
VKKDPPPPPPVKKGPWLDYEVRGNVAVGETITLLVKSGNLPKRSKIEALVKRTQTGPFKPLSMVATGTVTMAKIEIDRPKIEIFVRAKQGKKIVAQLGSELEPIILSTAAPPPPLSQAWSETPPVSSVRTTTVATSTRTQIGEVVVAPPPPPVAGGGLSGLEIGLIAGGAAVIVVTVAVVVIVLATRKTDCDVEEGFGCAEVQVLPLMRF